MLVELTEQELQTIFNLLGVGIYEGNGLFKKLCEDLEQKLRKEAQ